VYPSSFNGPCTRVPLNNENHYLTFMNISGGRVNRVLSLDLSHTSSKVNQSKLFSVFYTRLWLVNVTIIVPVWAKPIGQYLMMELIEETQLFISYLVNGMHLISLVNLLYKSDMLKNCNSK